jgi:hypothetical protein
VGLALRFALAPFLGHPYDLRVFMAAGWAVGHGQTPYGEYFLQSILSNISHPHLSGFFYGIGYPPVWGLILGLMYQLSNIISPNSIYVYAFTLKIPIIIFDVATAFLLRKLLTLKLNVQVASKVFQFYLLCPFMLLVGVVWGMFDVAVFFFSIFSAYLLLTRASLSAASLAIACVLKPYAIILVPLYSIFIYKTSRSFSKAFFFFVGVSSMVAVVTFIPMFWFNWPISNLYYALSSQMAPADVYYSGQDFTYGAASPFNLFNVVRLINVEFVPASILNYAWIAACMILYVYVALQKLSVDFKSIVYYSFLTSLVFFTTRSWVSEQNLLFLLSFFTLVLVFNEAREGWKHIHALWILLSVFVLIHVPASSFMWMVYPETLNAASAFCNGPLGYLRWVSMSILTFSWLILLWHNVSRRQIKL